MAQFVNTALSSLVANMYIPALYKRLQDSFLGTLIFQVPSWYHPQPAVFVKQACTHIPLFQGDTTQSKSVKYVPRHVTANVILK